MLMLLLRFIHYEKQHYLKTENLANYRWNKVYYAKLLVHREII